MVATRASVSPTLACTTLCIACLLFAGCGGAGDAISSFAGGSKSDDKQEIPSALNNADANSPAGATPTAEANAGATAATQVAAAAKASAAGNLDPVSGIQGPAAVSKGTDRTVPSTEAERKVLRESKMAYKAGRKRDPFLSLVGGTESKSGLVDLSVVTLVGVVNGKDAFCIVEDTGGTSFILRKGDRVKNGRVVSIGSDKITASQTVLGYTTTVQLKLESGKDGLNG